MRVGADAMSAPRLSSSAQLVGAAVFSRLQPHIDARLAQGGALVGLHIGDTHELPPEAARRVLDEARGDDRAHYVYGATAGQPELRRTFAHWLSRHGLGEVDAERELLLGAGGTHAVACALRAVLDPGDEVMVLAPYWPLVPGAVRAASATVVEVDVTQRLYADRALSLRAMLEERLSPRTKVIYFISPNNPDGKVLERAHLEELRDFAQEHGLWVVADEVYVATLDGAPPSPFRALAPERTLAVYSLSKTHALAGMRVGFVVAPPEVVATARRLSAHSVFSVPRIAQDVARAALEDDDFMRAMGRRVAAARRAVAERLRAGGLTFHEADAGTYQFIDFRPQLGERPLQALLERLIDRGVLLAPGSASGASYTHHARLCVTAAPVDAVLGAVDVIVDEARAFAAER